jgi:acetyl-CoA carboxylase biotin carboxylase subunit
MMTLAAGEAHAAFGEGRLYLERHVTGARHVEVQVLGDGQRAIHFGDRDCSVQRRYQKLIEEAPAPHISQTLRTALHEAAIGYAGALGYRGLGTVEFLLDGDRGEFYFLEMNARIQVEHPVTETISGIDLVAEQIAVAEGAPLRLSQSDVRLDGHAIECRLNAEDPRRDFRACPGVVEAVDFPSGPGIRVDTAIEAGTNVPPFYDSLLAKIIARAPTRAEALAALRRALSGTRIVGVATNRDLHMAILEDGEFIAGGMDTGYLARFLARDFLAGGRERAAGGA